MAIEIERKFLLADESWREQINASHRITQGYLVSAPREGAMASVRVRIQDDKANINIKSAGIAIHRNEYEYPIPLSDAEELIGQLCHQPVIDKLRHVISAGDHTWEIDEFFGANAGLIVAELELSSVDEAFTRPGWLGEEVSDDPRYYNVNLMENPYSSWR